MGVAVDQVVADQPFAPLAAIANTKAQLGGKPYGTTLAEYNRLRATLAAALDAQGISGSRRAVSGPWPINSTPGTFLRPTGLFFDIDFYYPDTGAAEKVDVVFQNTLTSTDINAQEGSHGAHCGVVVGGDKVAHVKAIFAFVIERLNTAGPDPGNPAASVDTNFPGANFTLSQPNQPFNGAGSIQVWKLYCKIDGDVPPGTYFFDATVAAPAALGGGSLTGGGLNDIDNDGVGHGVSPLDCRLSSSVTSEVPGIHDSKRILKIQVDRLTANGVPFGVYGFGGADGQTLIVPGDATSYQASTPGFYFGKMPAVDFITQDLRRQMPWNAGRNAPYEESLTPGDWQPNTVYSAGEQRLDTNGNLQRCIFAAGIRRSAGIAPDWSTVIGGVTPDNPPNLQWQLLKIMHSMSAIARMFSVPRYPCFRDGTASPELGNFAPAGWWIYRVFLNRIPPVNDNGIKAWPVAPGPAIPVQLGVIRNGVFVAFGAYQTGTVVEAKWPVFTATALCYQAAEEVDVQASIITIAADPGRPRAHRFNGAISYPLAAAHFNDIEALLALLS
jgi:hypothetical protein